MGPFRARLKWEHHRFGQQSPSASPIQWYSLRVLLSNERRAGWLAASAVVAAGIIAACGVDSSDGDCKSYACGGDPNADPDAARRGDGDAPEDPGPPFEPAPPSTYVPKVKTILTGLAATDAEVAAVTADPNALRGLIDQWTALPQFKTRALDFFRNAFQQNQVTLNEMMDANGQGTNFGMNADYRRRLERSLMDSFPLTVWSLLEAGRPLTDALTTDTFQLTTAQLGILTYLDEMRRNDDFSLTNRLAPRVPENVVFDPASTATLAQSANKGGPSFMVWPQNVTAGPRCQPGTITLSNGNKLLSLQRYLYGSSPCFDPTLNPPGNNAQNVPPRFSDADFTDFRPVRIEPAGAGNTTPVFYDVPALRSANSLKLHTTRIGFAGTLAFSTNWPTNAGNDARVIANQILIVALGYSINGEGVMASFPVEISDVDEAHSSNPECASCHTQLDPLKQYVKKSQTLYYGEQTDPAQAALPAVFDFDGVTATGDGLGDLMTTLAAHPRVAPAWTQKLYFWGASHGANVSDPEFQRVAGVFRDSGYDFKALVRELFSSPLITYASPTQSTRVAGGDAPSIARRDQYCTALSNRLGLEDVCGMLTPTPSKSQAAIGQTATMMAADGYFRSYELPSLPTSPDLFFRASAESMCQQIADLVVDAPGGGSTRYSSADPAAAISDLVAQVMGLPPSDPRAAPAAQILAEHLAAATTADGGAVSATDALKSTFQLACLSPSSVIVGL